MTDLPWLAPFLQTNDALFPTGAYAHSLGFEEAVHLGVVTDEPTLLTFLTTQILPAQREQELPYLRYAHEAATAGDLHALCALDAEISAWKLASETRDASAQLGRRRLKALRVISTDPLLAAFEVHIAQREAQGHHLIVFALQAAVERIPLEAALGAWLYQSLAAICGAALKLIRIGQDGCQRALRGALRDAPAAIAASLEITRPHAGWFNPVLEIASMRHARAHERLFIS